jgi:hypothetical protein
MKVLILTLLAMTFAATSAFASGIPVPVPDGGSSALLLAIALGGLALRRKLRR